jgi:hypothetical protein
MGFGKALKPQRHMAWISGGTKPRLGFAQLPSPFRRVHSRNGLFLFVKVDIVNHFEEVRLKSNIQAMFRLTLFAGSSWWIGANRCLAAVVGPCCDPAPRTHAHTCWGWKENDSSLRVGSALQVQIDCAIRVTSSCMCVMSSQRVGSAIGTEPRSVC